MNQPVVFFPINQREQAVQASAEVLLALDVYKKLADIVREATDLAQRAREQGVQSEDVNQHRAHTAVLIDGLRGTGKSSVLVNMAKYLGQRDPGLEKRVHFLNPLDPTLLETTDDLFLNEIVAGLVSDEAIQAARQAGDEKANFFHEQLQRLGNTLERLESQRDLRGLDKLRAFMGNQHLAQEVHLVFKAGLDLLGKQLLVLPIDDVDTSLDRAFDNLEVIRKYLVSPYVLPVISGDLDLYNDLSWRHFHGRLLKDSNADSADAVARAKDLAQEYQRKILPLQYRIEMPEVLHYLRSPLIGFYDEDQKPVPEITMAHFYSWLEAVLNERTNGSENSYLQPPVKNMRSLAQLVGGHPAMSPENLYFRRSESGIDDPKKDPIVMLRQGAERTPQFDKKLNLIIDHDSDDELRFMHVLQDHLLETYRLGGLTIETNPTSNLYIARLGTYAEHPIFRWSPPDALLLLAGAQYNQYGLRQGPIAVTINTDDPGIMPTTLRTEFSLVAAAGRGLHPSAGVEQWLNAIKQHGNALFQQNHHAIWTTPPHA
ncbi:hypothetical protein [Massilia scottii]|uniref:hypothetical protein n=1 Tax=Massilia scottii TaxID=3057166 RepID=UPI002796AD2D|nr:hypothetical protein [Massilia sp. CCM 9029]MDQ1833713.1 hypothetical protein [Massilia sp. CCM 9029]